MTIEQIQLPHTAAADPFTLGLSRRDGHMNVAVYAPAIEALDIHFKYDGVWQHARLSNHESGVHYATIPALAAGTPYGFWATGQTPGAQLLLDPYGKAIVEEEVDGETVYYSSHTERDFDWGEDKSPRTPERQTVIYEAHVKGLTINHPGIPEELRGTYAGLAHPEMIAYLQRLGVTAVELLPVHFHIDEPHLQELGFSNYWGYNTLGYFALHSEYASAAARAGGPQAVQDEFKGMVKLLHRAGLEVILDVVYNHTAEGGKGGPELSWRGLGEQDYYRHDVAGNYVDTTGCGNTLDFSNKRVAKMALDSLRYWVKDFHIDGFRFDLATSLARDENHEFTPMHPFLHAAALSDDLSGVKLISEPWDVGLGGWQTGNFPHGWSDWNDRFRDTVRDFWLTDQAAQQRGDMPGSVAALATRIAGSADLFTTSGRTAMASVNFVTAHDGFTMADLTSYDRKHNEANGEENRDGTDNNRSYNHGVEGHTADCDVRAARELTARNLMATLLLSRGVPMISMGDEVLRTQNGNNNAYCQDSEISYMDWNFDEHERHMFDVTRRLIKIRQSFLKGQPYEYWSRPDGNYMLWFDAQGTPMSIDAWNDPNTRVVQVILGSPNGAVDGMIVINGSLSDVEVTLPDEVALESSGAFERNSKEFDLLLATADRVPAQQTFRGGDAVDLPANSIQVFRAN